MNPSRALTAACLALLLCACSSFAPPANRPVSTAPVPDAPSVRPTVLLVSIDGFRDDYLDLGITPNLARIAGGGVRAEWMNPSYPTLTFPNHYSIVTGLRPDRHGIVHNTMRDPQLGRFSLGNREALADGRWWGGEPVWVGAERAGLPTATLFWPGSEAPIDGVRPSRWLAYDGEMPMDRRVDTVLAWLSEDDATRPRFATLYFEALDHAGHEHGPDSSEAHDAIRATDAALGRLLEGLDSRALLQQVNLIVVSDHGMAAVTRERIVAIEDMVDPADATVVTAGQSLGFAPVAGRERAAEAQLLGSHPHHDCWRKSELPPSWHYGRNARLPAIVCQMHEGWDAMSRERAQQRQARATSGSHGFDPALASMRAMFVAHGPAFRRGTTLPPFDNVDVYPLLARLVGIEPAENDGSAATWTPALAPQAPRVPERAPGMRAP